MIELGVLTPAGWLLVAQVVDGKVVDLPDLEPAPTVEAASE